MTGWDAEVTKGDIARLDSAFRALARAYGGVDAAAMAAGRDKAQISRYGSPNTDVHAPVDVVARLEREVGPVVTRELARQSGHVLIALPDGGGDDLWVEHLSVVAAEASDVISRLGTALAGKTREGVVGTITAQESVELHLLDECREAIEGLVALERSLIALEAAEVKD